MESIKIISRREILEKELIELERHEEKINKELSEISEKCNHSIMVKPIPQVANRSFDNYTYCLFCGGVTPFVRKFKPLKSFEKMTNSVTIRMKDYPFYCAKEKNVEKELRKLYCNLAKEFPKDSDEEIANKMKEELEEKNRKLKENT